MLVAAVVAVLVIYEVTRNHTVNADEVIFFVVLIPSIILHEVSHGAVALVFGDDTAKRAGRLTLNPLRHVDPIGTVILPAILVLAHAPAFGYAKPVPVNVSRLRDPRNQSVVVSLAGPMVNIIISAACLVGLRYVATPFTMVNDVNVGGWSSWNIVYWLGLANVLLAAFNLLPIPPLDGSAVIERLLPRSWWPGWLRLRTYALPVLILLVLWLPQLRAGLFDHVANWWDSLL